MIGTNKFWKQNADMGKRSNQNFVSIPHAELRQKIAYKAMIAGITVIEQEESYTSKSDVTANDPIPVRFLAGESAEDGIRLIAA